MVNISNFGTELDNKFVCSFIDLAPVVQKEDNAIHRINLYPADNEVSFPNTYSQDSDLSSG